MKGDTLGDDSRGGDPRFEREAKFLSRVNGDRKRYEGDEEVFSKEVHEGEFCTDTFCFFLCVPLRDASPA